MPPHRPRHGRRRGRGLGRHGLRGRQRRGLLGAGRSAGVHRRGSPVRRRLRAAGRARPAGRPPADLAARHGMAVAVRYRRDRPGGVQPGAGRGVPARRTCRPRRGRGLCPRRAGPGRPAAGGDPPADRGGGRRPRRDGRRRAGAGARPDRRRRRGLGRRGLRLRGRVHPAGHPGARPARPVGGVGARHLARHGDVRRAGHRPRRASGHHDHDPGGLARRRLPRGRGHRGGLRPVVFQCPAARGQPGRAAHRDRPGGRRGQRGPARRPGAQAAGLGRASRSSRPAWPSASGRGGPDALPARGRALAGLPVSGPRRPVRRGHHRRRRRRHGPPDRHRQGPAGGRPGIRVPRDPGLAARLRADGPEADPVPLRGRVAAAPVPQGGQPAAAAPAGRPVQRGLAGLRRPGRRPRRGPDRLAARGTVRGRR